MDVQTPLTPAETQNTGLTAHDYSTYTQGPGDYAATQPSNYLDSAEAMAAGFVKDTWMGSLAEQGLVAGHVAGIAGGLPDAGPGPWNPYQYLKSNLSPEDYKALELPIRTGVFEDADTPRAVLNKVAWWGKEKAIRDEVANNPTAGAIGGMAGQALDPLNLVGGPWAFAPELSTAAKMARGAALFGGITTAQELALHSLQDMRTLHESVMDVGGAAVMGGGVGALGFGLGLIAPGAAKGLDAAGNLMGRLADRYGPEGRTLMDDYMSTVSRDAVGAQATPHDELPVDLTQPAPTKFGGFDAMDKTLSYFSPLARMMQAGSDTARNFVLRMSESNGMSLVDRDGNWVATPNSAEGLSRQYRNQWDVTYRQHMTATLQQLSQDLAGMSAPKVNTADFLKTYLAPALDDRINADQIGEGITQRAIQQFGSPQAALKVLDTAHALAGTRQQIDASIEQALVDHGYVQNVPRLDNANRQLATARAVRDAEVGRDVNNPGTLIQARQVAKEAASRTTNTATANPTLQAEARDALAAHDAKIAEREEFHRQEIAKWDAIRNEERAKAEPLGDKYGYAQLYDQTNLRAHLNEFKQMLLEKFADQPYGPWLREVHGVAPDEFAKMADADPGRHAEIMSSWTADEHYVKLAVAQKRVAAAAERHEAAKTDVRQAAGNSRYAAEQARQSEGAMARAEIRRKTAERDAAFAEKQGRQATRDALKAAAQRARQGTLDRQSMELVHQPDVGEAELVSAITKGKAAEAARTKAMADPVTAELERLKPGTVETAGDVGPKITKAQAAADKATTQPLEAPKAPDPQMSLAASKLEGRVQELERRIQDADTRTGNASMRVSEIEEKLAELDRTDSVLKYQREQAAEALKTTNAQRGLAAKNVSEAQRLLRKEKGTAAISDVVDQMADNIATNGNVPRGDGNVDGVLNTPGRLKERHIDWTPAERQRLIDMGVLRDDLPGIWSASYGSMAGHLGIRDALGIGKPGGYKSYGDAVDTISRDYQDRISSTTGAARVAVEKERDMVLKNADLLKSRLIGADLSGIRDKSSLFYWGSSKLMQANLADYGAGFGLSSMTHTAGVLMNHKMGDLLKAAAQMAAGSLKGAAGDTIRTIEKGTEESMHGVHNADASTWQDLANQRGAGVRGTATHKITGALDHVMDKAVDLSTKFSGLPLMTKFVRMASAMDTLQQMSKKLGNYAALSDIEKSHFAQLGIDAPKAAALADQLAQHGTRDEHGFLSPNVDRWTDRQAAATLDMAIQRDVAQASPTRSIGDTPAFMSSHMGKLLTQFQGWNMVAYNHVISPVKTRLLYQSDYRMLSVMATIMGMATMNVAARDALMGKNPMDRFKDSQTTRDTVVNLVDRSGLMGYLAPYVDAAGKMAGVLGQDSSSRFRNNQDAWQSLLGPSMSRVGNIAKVGSAASQWAAGTGSGDKTAQAAARVAPFGLWARSLTHLATQ